MQYLVFLTVLPFGIAFESSLIIFQNSINKGAAYSRNFAIKKAKGDYIAFLDGDDLWAPEKTKKQINFMEKNHFPFTYTFYQHFYDSTKKYGKVIKSPKMVKAKDLLKSNFIGCLTVIIDKDQVGDFFMPDLRYAEDSLTWEMILNRGYTAYCYPEVCAFYRKSDSSATHKKTNAAKQRWQLYRNYYHFTFLKSIFYFGQYIFYSIKKHFL